MKIGFYIYQHAEVLDLSGPFEVFSTAKRVGWKSWNIFFIAETDALVKARGNFLVFPHYIGFLKAKLSHLQGFQLL